MRALKGVIQPHSLPFCSRPPLFSPLSLATPRIATCPQQKPLDLFPLPKLEPLKRTQPMGVIKPQAVRATQHGTSLLGGLDLPHHGSTGTREKRPSVPIPAHTSKPHMCQCPPLRCQCHAPERGSGTQVILMSPQPWLRTIGSDHLHKGLWQGSC